MMEALRRARQWLRHVRDGTQPKVLDFPVTCSNSSIALNTADKSVDQRADLARIIDGTYPLSDDFQQKYEIDMTAPLLGEGSFGFVLKAKDLISGRRVAVKFITRQRIPLRQWINQRGGRAIPEEVFLLRSIKHSNIVQYYSHHFDASYVYLVTELFGTRWSIDDNARDLFACVEARVLEWFEAKHVLSYVVSALMALENHGYVHGDLKDENVLVDSTYTAKLIDLGSVQRNYNHLVHATEYTGTALYAAPEIVSGERYLPAAAQVWSLGIMLYVMIYGTSPFRDPANIVVSEYFDDGRPGSNVVAAMLQRDYLLRPTLSDIANFLKSDI